MPIVYFDSSALVKLLVEEDGSEIAAALWDGCDAPVSNRLAHPEVRAALAAAARAHRLSRAGRSHAEAMWEEYWAALHVVELSEAISSRAGQLAAMHALGGADAVHLASGLAVGASATVFAVWDARLATGALRAGFQVAPNHPDGKASIKAS
ncbi:MAG: type II toxin-antitoxin system VapC family toxin [Intrasporangium sp.]|uniref:type II toxin-antitoxin system VapC family toxin n=1 Tax=Intrasporangium sp. TaxID=1925024 RepID=UPI002649D7BC|nr:type II toxin-antitoxin system VapC family toxin [Intrasporangium sp.]MDN5797534.1 type II toxin-antitoxin system VapC family toxin [Intrasporangium sp.]